jgi:hypothetical protein
MARQVYMDDPDLAAIHAAEAFTEEQTATYGHQPDQMEAEAAAAEAETAAAAWRLRKPGPRRQRRKRRPDGRLLAAREVSAPGVAWGATQGARLFLSRSPYLTVRWPNLSTRRYDMIKHFVFTREKKHHRFFFLIR